MNYEPLKKKQRKNEQPFTYISKYNKNNPDLFAKISKIYINLKSLIECLKNSNTTKVFGVKLQLKNSKEIIALSKFGKHAKHGVSKCKNSKTM